MILLLIIAAVIGMFLILYGVAEDNFIGFVGCLLLILVFFSSKMLWNIHQIEKQTPVDIPEELAPLLKDAGGTEYISAHVYNDTLFLDFLPTDTIVKNSEVIIEEDSIETNY